MTQNTQDKATAAHTPGPWIIDPTIRRGKDNGKHAFFEISGPELFWVAKVQAFDDDPGKYAANAHLISAAPELLDALKLARKCIAYCRKHHKDIQSGDGVPVEKFLDAAIAKAEGSR